MDRKHAVTEQNTERKCRHKKGIVSRQCLSLGVVFIATELPTFPEGPWC